MKQVKLSVVIVNYNVEFFLEQCLNSVYKALHNIEAEVFVVDNNSVDGSVDMVSSRFPEARLIANKVNTGFAVANNQAIKESSGEYVLLLNPDTLVQEDTFRKVIDFMDSHPDAGGLGVKMIDGKGNFLPESKRGLPTPKVAFYKIFGFSAFFPGSKTFGRYHLGYLSKDENHEVDVLSGAFMLLRKKTLEKTGLLDEAFFMYGEDIDLSYRITLAGYKNYYFAGTSIIHYKGESTKKGSLNYVFVFYRAMVIFAKKHFSSQNARLLSFFINTAIWFRASIAVLYRFLKVIWLPALDLSAITALIVLSSGWYEQSSGKNLDDHIIYYAFPSLALLWMAISFFSSVYDRPFKALKLVRSALYATGIALVVYSLLPESLRFSRAMVLIGCASAFAWMVVSRLLLSLMRVGFYGAGSAKVKRFAIVGRADEVARITDMIAGTHQAKTEFYSISPENVHQLNDLVRINQVHEIVFSGKDLSSQQIIGLMTDIDAPYTDFKIAPPESLFIIGSNSIDTQGDYYMVEMQGIHSAINQRNKRLTDILLSLVFIAFSPLLSVIVERRTGFLKNLLLTLIGEISWVGFSKSYSSTLKNHRIKKGVIPVAEGEYDGRTNLKLNLLYAKNYSWNKDVTIVFRHLKKLGNPAV